MDEPFSGIDKSTHNEIVRELNNIDAAVLMITHNREIAKIFDVVYEIEEGKFERIK